MGIRCADHVTPLYPQKLALTSPTGGGRSGGIVRSRTKATEFFSYSILFTTTYFGLSCGHHQGVYLQLHEINCQIEASASHMICTVITNKILLPITLILRRSRTGTVWFYTSTSNKRAARPKLYTESLTRDLKRMYSRFTLVRISINL